MVSAREEIFAEKLPFRHTTQPRLMPLVLSCPVLFQLCKLLAEFSEFRFEKFLPFFGSQLEVFAIGVGQNLFVASLDPIVIPLGLLREAVRFDGGFDGLSQSFAFFDNGVEPVPIRPG